MKVEIRLSKTLKWEISGAEGQFVVRPYELKKTIRKEVEEERWVEATTQTRYFTSLLGLTKHLSGQQWVGQEGLEYDLHELVETAKRIEDCLNGIHAQLVNNTQTSALG